MDTIFEISFITTWLAAAMRLTGPLLLASLGELYSERTGVLNVGIEGTILLGALGAYLGAIWTGSPWAGVLMAVVTGLTVNIFLAWMYVIVKASQVVVGIIFNVLAFGLAAYSFRALMGDVPQIVSAPMLPEVNVPYLSDIPIVGRMLFEQSIMLYITLILAIVAGVVLYKTRFGLNLRAVGENPKAAASAGTNVVRMRIIGVLISGLGGGLAGAYFVLVQIGVFRETIVQGRGFIALGIVILARWNPYLAVAAAFGFAAMDALPLSLQLLDLDIAPQLLVALPYMLTVLAVSGLLGRSRNPEALMVPYDQDR
ncbi:ABC transporter permease [Hoeflea sp.]|uniref:ABC transporter permease n=1 Tax=Hoeflea sp. TaxID=1940281 RepID=UPI003B020636